MLLISFLCYVFCCVVVVRRMLGGFLSSPQLGGPSLNSLHLQENFTVGKKQLTTVTHLNMCFLLFWNLTDFWYLYCSSFGVD